MKEPPRKVTAAPEPPPQRQRTVVRLIAAGVLAFSGTCSAACINGIPASWHPGKQALEQFCVTRRCCHGQVTSTQRRRLREGTDLLACQCAERPAAKPTPKPAR